MGWLGMINGIITDCFNHLTGTPWQAWVIGSVVAHLIILYRSTNKKDKKIEQLRAQLLNSADRQVLALKLQSLLDQYHNENNPDEGYNISSVKILYLKAIAEMKTSGVVPTPLISTIEEIISHPSAPPIALIDGLKRIIAMLKA